MKDQPKFIALLMEAAALVRLAAQELDSTGESCKCCGRFTMNNFLEFNTKRDLQGVASKLEAHAAGSGKTKAVAQAIKDAVAAWPTDKIQRFLEGAGTNVQDAGERLNRSWHLAAQSEYNRRTKEARDAP